MIVSPRLALLLADASTAGAAYRTSSPPGTVDQDALTAALPARLRAAVLLLTRHGLRVSEVVRVRAADLTDASTLRLLLSKGNGTRVIQDAEIVGLLGGPGQQPADLALVPYTARAVRATMDRLGHAYLPPGHQHRRVSHAGRARVMQQLSADGLTDAEIASRMQLAEVQTVSHYLDTPPARP